MQIIDVVRRAAGDTRDGCGHTQTGCRWRSEVRRQIFTAFNNDLDDNIENNVIAFSNDTKAAIIVSSRS